MADIKSDSQRLRSLCTALRTFQTSASNHCRALLAYLVEKDTEAAEKLRQKRRRMEENEQFRYAERMRTSDEDLPRVREEHDRAKRREEREYQVMESLYHQFSEHSRGLSSLLRQMTGSGQSQISSGVTFLQRCTQALDRYAAVRFPDEVGYNSSELDSFTAVSHPAVSVNLESGGPSTVSGEGEDSFPESSLLPNDVALIRQETGWSDEIISHILNMEQYRIYKAADLHEAVVNGRACLIKKIDFNYIDPKPNKTNAWLLKNNKAPIDPATGERIELHHMGQDYDGPFVELCENTEHGDGNHHILHPSVSGSFRNDPGLEKEYAKQRKAHRRARLRDYDGDIDAI